MEKMMTLLLLENADRKIWRDIVSDKHKYTQL